MTAAPTLATQLDAGLREQRRKAMRTMLTHPLLSATCDPEAFALVRRHADWLGTWLGKHTHWRLQIDTEVARLRKHPADLTDNTRPACDPRTGAPFTRRRYVLFSLALAALERADRQTVLGQLAQDITGFVTGDPQLGEAGIVLDLTQQDQRRDLATVIRLLIDLGVLVRIDGDEEHYIANKGDVLYTIQRAALAWLLNVRRGPSTIEATAMDDRLHALACDPLPDHDEARNRAVRHRLMTRLLDDPVLYDDELDEAERAYLRSQRPHMLRELEDATGLVPEARREGIALADPRGDATDLGMPEEGTDGHLALLLAEWLAHHGRSADDAVAAIVGLATIRAQTAALISRYGEYWRKAAREPGAEVGLTQQTLDRLEALRLIRRVEDGVETRPALARYALEPPRAAGGRGDTAAPALWEAQP